MGVALGAVLALSGCVFNIDDFNGELHLVNDSTESAIFVIEESGEQLRSALILGESEGGIFPPDECWGDAIHVEDEDGTVLARIEESACPWYTLTFHADGTLTLSETE